MTDLLVVGFDLESEREVHIEDEPLPNLRTRAYGQRETLVCALCYLGAEASPGTRVPLLVRHRVGGARRAHFAHPRGMAPASGHRPESVWHLQAKSVLARWARSLPNVADVGEERWTPDRKRRADVEVLLTSGARVALEVQSTSISDIGWLARHHDYRRQGIVDVWFWWPELKTHWTPVLREQQLWRLEPSRGTVALLVGAPHAKPNRWWEQEDLSHFVRHLPPCPGDPILPIDVPLASLALDDGGLRVPPDVRDDLHRRQGDIRQAAERARLKARASAKTTRGARHGQAHDPRNSPNRVSVPLPADHCLQCHALSIIRMRRADESTDATAFARAIFVHSDGGAVEG